MSPAVAGLFRSHIEHCYDQGTHLAEDVKTTMGAFGKVNGFLRAKQSFDETIEFLTTDQRQSGETFTRCGYIETGQGVLSAGCRPPRIASTISGDARSVIFKALIRGCLNEIAAFGHPNNQLHRKSGRWRFFVRFPARVGAAAAVR
jgi:hypothetical protein